MIFVLIINVCEMSFFVQSFNELPQRPLLVDLTVEEGSRLKVIYGSEVGFHAIDVDSGNIYDIYIPSHVSVCLCINDFVCLHSMTFSSLFHPLCNLLPVVSSRLLLLSSSTHTHCSIYWPRTCCAYSFTIG